MSGLFVLFFWVSWEESQKSLRIRTFLRLSVLLMMEYVTSAVQSFLNRRFFSRQAMGIIILNSSG